MAVNTSIPKIFGSTPKYLHKINQDSVSVSTPVPNFSPFTGLQEDVLREPQMLAEEPQTLDKTKLNSELLQSIEINQGRKSLALNFSNSHLPSFRKTLEYTPGIADNVGFLPWEKNNLELLNERRLSRKLLDTFGESLLHVNRLYNREFGFEARRVPAHMAHLMDRTIMTKVQERYSE